MGRAGIGYINKDYESIRKELLSKIPQLTDRWTDFNHSDLGIVLLDMFCGIADMLTYYLDTQAAEAFIPTARQRQNVINLCKLIGYRLDTPVSSTTAVRFSLPEPVDHDILIPARTQCRALTETGNIDFETVEDVIIPHGEIFTDAYTRQGVRKSEEFEATGQPWQKFRLTGSSIAQDTVSVRIDDIDWTEIYHFQDSDMEDIHFMTDTDALDITSILFGDGKSGKIPVTGKTIHVSWLETLGAEGNIAPGQINQLLTPVYFENIQIQLKIYNPVAATGGSSRETVRHARDQAPAELKTLWKAVTLEDYKTLAEGYPGVSKARVLDTNTCHNIRYYNVYLAIAPDGGGLPSQLLKRELLAYLESRKVITVEVKLCDPVYRSINIDCEVYVWPGEFFDNVRSRIEDALNDFLAFDNVDFGKTVYSSDLISLIDGVRGVSHIKLYTPQIDIVLNRGEIPVPGTVNLDIRRAE